MTDQPTTTDQPTEPPASAARREPMRRSRGPLLASALAPLLLVVTFVAGVTLDRTGLLPGSPYAPAPVPGATSSPTPGGGSPAPSAPSGGSPAPSLRPGESPTITFPPGVTGLGLIEQAWTTLHENYVLSDRLDDRAMAYAAIRAMTEAVGDQGHTMFFTPEELAALEQSLSGEFVGIGVEVDTSKGTFRIADVIPGTPAEEAGLRTGDVIVKADGVALDGLTQEAAFARIRGPEGVPVVLTIERDTQAPFDVRLVRRAFELPLVSWTMVPGTKVAFVRLESFSSGAADALKGALRDAREQGATRLLLDLRGNPGGYVNEAVAVASQFLSDGVVYVTRDKAGKEEPSMVEPGGLWTDLPMAVLVDGNTASAAEIVSGALQDAKRGPIIGEQTFGTGTVLGRYDLADGSSLRIGTVLWLTRNGRPLWNEGLTPDIKVPLADDQPRARPRDVEKLAPDAVTKDGDAQFVRGLEELERAR